MSNTNWGDLNLNNFVLSGYKFVLSALEGEITLGDGFTIVSDAKTSLDIGLQGSVTGALASGRQAAAVAENVDRSDERVLVFPNPTDGVVNIQPVSDLGLYRIQITDLQGKVVYEEQSQQEGTRHIQLRERNIKAGHYILHILPKDKQASSHSLIVQ